MITILTDKGTNNLKKVSKDKYLEVEKIDITDCETDLSDFLTGIIIKLLAEESEK